MALAAGQRVRVALEVWAGGRYVPPCEREGTVASGERWAYLPHSTRRGDSHGHWWGTVAVIVDGEREERRVSVCRVRAVA